MPHNASSSSTGPRLTLALAAIAATTLWGCGDRPQPRPPEPARVVTPPAPPGPPTIGPGPGQRGQAGGQSANQPTNDDVLRRVSGPDDDATRLEVGGIVAPKPTQWTWQQPSMQFRTLQYAVPAPGASTGSAELIVSVFFDDDGGPTQTNVDRWVGQFRSAEGGPIEAIRSERTIDGMNVILLELAGSYQGMGGTGPKPDFMQFGAIIEAPARRVFIRLLGPASTVEANREEWNALVEGLQDAAAAD